MDNLQFHQDKVKTDFERRNSKKKTVNYKFVNQDGKWQYNFINIGSNQVHKEKWRKIRSCKFFTVREMENYKIVN